MKVYFQGNIVLFFLLLQQDSFLSLFSQSFLKN